MTDANKDSICSRFWRKDSVPVKAAHYEAQNLFQLNNYKASTLIFEKVQSAQEHPLAITFQNDHEKWM
jgi:hypothetical protein